MASLFEVQAACARLGNVLERREREDGFDITKIIVSVEREDFQIVYIPKGRENDAKSHIDSAWAYPV